MKTHSEITTYLETKGYTFKAVSNKTDISKEAEVPFIVKALSVFGGISTMGLVLFLYVLLELHKNDTITVVSGFIFVAGGILMSRHKLSLLFNSFGITMFLSGLMWIILGLQKQHLSDETVFGICAVIGLLSWLFSGSYLLKTVGFITTGLALVAFNYTDVKVDLQFLLYVYTVTFSASIFLEAQLMSNEWKTSRLFYSLRSGSLFLLLYLLVCLSLNIADFEVAYKWISSIPFVLLIGYLTYKLTHKLNLKTPLYAYIIAGIICGSAFMAPSILGGLTILLLTFYVNYKTGFVFGILSIIYFVSLYYYDLDLTLLEKSGVMFGTGLVLILIYLIIRKQWSYEK